jgi:hypothetical protein
MSDQSAWTNWRQRPFAAVAAHLAAVAAHLAAVAAHLAAFAVGAHLTAVAAHLAAVAAHLAAVAAHLAALAAHLAAAPPEVLLTEIFLTLARLFTISGSVLCVRVTGELWQTLGFLQYICLSPFRREQNSRNTFYSASSGV